MKREKKANEQKLRQLPIGNDDFEELINENYYFVDKSLFIKELLESGAKSTLIPRPRRFGKTLNMSMLKCFFEKTKKSRASLFHNLEIAKYKEIMKHQGKYPVISITLKFIEAETWDETLDGLKILISDLYSKHIYLLKGQILNSEQKKVFKDIIGLRANKASYKVSLRRMTEYLSEYYQQKPIVLIDEYDVPIQAGFRHGYYDEVTLFVKSLLGDATKGNNHLKFAVMTGALRIAKEGIFTGMNNPDVCTIFDKIFSDKFGLMENEVKELLSYYGLKNNMADVRSWYNGYSSGQLKVYNPWSIINFAKRNGELKAYWVNTSSNDLMESLIRNSSDNAKKEIEQLLTGSYITKEICEYIVYPNLKIDSSYLWNYLLFCGYLTFKNKRMDESKKICADFLIPNEEVKLLFESTILSWFKPQGSEGSYEIILQSLINGDMARFNKQFSKFVSSTLSYFDISGEDPERFYHALVLGMLVSLSTTHEVRSNRESGDGRYDVMLIPKDISKVGIVIEFKKVDIYEKEKIDRAVTNALKQIKEKKYANELFSLGINSVIGVAIAFEGKKVLIQSENLSRQKNRSLFNE